jgi:iron complex transport system substrate-binding protein
LEEVLGCLLELGERTGTRERAERIVRDARARIEKVRALAQDLPPVRVFFLEWVEPPYCAGHWVPGRLAAAGGHDAFGRQGGESVRVAWEEALRWDPEVLFVSPCGFNASQAQARAQHLKDLPGWEGLTAVRKGRVFALDGNALFARPGPRLVEGLEILAHLLHPDVFPRPDLPDAFRAL